MKAAPSAEELAAIVAALQSPSFAPVQATRPLPSRWSVRAREEARAAQLPAAWRP